MEGIASNVAGSIFATAFPLEIVISQSPRVIAIGASKKSGGEKDHSSSTRTPDEDCVVAMARTVRPVTAGLRSAYSLAAKSYSSPTRHMHPEGSRNASCD